mgnify:CR=1 FL=1|tara:strand:+ start:214 stop:510 length:297 start_codon:yes stop_codon:yes gene_type:complete
MPEYKDIPMLEYYKIQLDCTNLPMYGRDDPNHWRKLILKITMFDAAAKKRSKTCRSHFDLTIDESGEEKFIAEEVPIKQLRKLSDFLLFILNQEEKED